MLVAQRHQLILELLEQKNAIKIEDLKPLFPVSESTLRNDLRYLEEKKKLRRSHGGAIKIQTNQETSFQQRTYSFKSEKENIGKAAAGLIRPDETIFLDAGTTVMELANNLPETFEFNIVTPSLTAAMAAGNHTNISVHLVGGVLRHSLQELVGPKAVQGFLEVSAQKVFLGASGLSFERGVSENHVFSAEVKKAMVASAEEVILLLDSSKIGKSYLMELLPLTKLDRIVTDSNISDQNYQKLVELGIQVLIA
ncbi:DeoR/GlpR family DNA-binding transcription regulator [Bacillus sp. V5-8f]|uniref:DeoR/GlpR family DNA-binding transcription regulator n=1 Tax=Bacillus sp. V5-8f TaxID=2053044 RepID=UPI000C779E89|nr:DeoR/GlpR family DNA-binding transcription regulator [Bacillus sp. V5-8f]PLT33732.1 hypothetical protein CUU64_11490 [Bacillus sp. V5-8f]